MQRYLVVVQDPESVLGHFTVGKRIALYMARVLPQHTIDHLVYETAQLLHEEDPDTATSSKAADRAPPKVGTPLYSFAEAWREVGECGEDLFESYCRYNVAAQAKQQAI